MHIPFQDIHVFCDLYEMARHSYKPFLPEQLNAFNIALNHLKQQVLIKKNNIFFIEW